MLAEGGDTDWSRIHLPRFLALGGAATLAIDILIYPLEAIKTKMQVEARARATLWRAFVETTARTASREGLRGFYRGFTLYTVGGLPSQGCEPPPSRQTPLSRRAVMRGRQVDRHPPAPFHAAGRTSWAMATRRTG